MLEVSAFVCMELNPNQQKPDAGRDDGVTFAEMIRNSTCGLLATGTCWESVGNKGISIPLFPTTPSKRNTEHETSCCMACPAIFVLAWLHLS